MLGYWIKFFFVFPLFICSKSIKKSGGPRLDIFSLKDYLGYRILFCMIKILFYFRSQQKLKQLTKGFFFSKFIDSKNISLSWDQKIVGQLDKVFFCLSIIQM